MKVLVVDDREDGRYMLESLLIGNGYDVRTAANGAQALEMLRNEKIDLIVSDILMPEMDGFRLCKTVRADETLASIPFIFYTATYTGPEDEEFANKIGADRFIVKPCEPDAFLRAVEEVTGAAERRREKKQPVSAEETELFKLYSERLVRKLEQKMEDAERELEARREVEKELRSSEKRLIDAQRIAQMGDFIWEAETGKITWSDALFELLKYEKTETINYAKVNAEIHHPEDLEEVTAWLDEAVASGSTELSPKEYRVVCKDGEIKYVRTTGVIEREEGKPVRVFATVQDITDRRQAEKDLLKNESRLQSMVRILNYQTDEIQDFLDYALNEAIALTESKIGYIYFYNEKRKKFILNSWSKAVLSQCEVADPQTVYQLEKTGLWGEAVRQRKEIVVNDFPAFNPFKKGAPEGHAPLYKFLTVPVFKGNEIVAVVGVANKETNYNNNDVLQLQLLMDGVWKEIEKKRSESALRESEKELRSLKEKLEAQVIERTMELQEKVRKLNKSEKAMLYMVEDLNQTTAELKEERRRLKEANKELEAFSYSVSHDLRAPLRAIDGFSRIIEEEYSGVLDDEGMRLLGVVRDNTKKMDELITDLLELSRTGRKEMHVTEVDMKEMAESIYFEIVPTDRINTFEFSVSDLPPVFADPSLMKRVWSNLISNAVKYTMPKDRRVIEISGRVEENSCVYTVRDTGVGFDEEYKDKLFALFQRLHKVEEFEGTGVGLAIVQRIISRHGGVVWAEGREGEGAVFSFSLPRKTITYEGGSE